MEADSILTDWIHTKFRLKKMKRAFTSWQEDLKGKAWNALYLQDGHQKDRDQSQGPQAEGQGG